MTELSAPQAGSRLAQIGPALLGASSFACADVLSKVALNAGADALTISVVRAVLGLAMLFAWLRLVPPAGAFAPRAKWISLGLGVLFAGNVFLLFKAFETVELALMIGAHPTTLAVGGILAALGAALCRVVVLLATRALLAGADALRITWYALLSSTVVFIIAALAAANWQPPATATGWLALVALSLAVTTGLIGVFASTARIGPFRTALFMNLEPLLTAIGSALFLGEVLTPLQALGGGVMLAALVMFQLRR